MPHRPAISVLLIQAVVLGLLQGLTEFLPVSSSGHLQGVPYLLGWDSGSLAFDVMVHAGTLVAVVWYFRSDLWWLAAHALGPRGTDTSERRQAWQLIGLLALGSLPAAAAGLMFADVFEAAFASPRIVAGFLYLTAVLLWAAERIRARRAVAAVPGVVDVDTVPATDDVGRDEWSVTAGDAVVIGVAQALAIFPGVSRSGATIAAGMSLGLSRTAAARFSFLLSIPVIIGATAVTLPGLGTLQPGALPFGPVEIAVGVTAAALSGYWAIRLLLDLVARRSLLVFAGYVVAFATLLLGATFVLG